MERLTNRGTNGEIWITDNDETRKYGRKESAYKKLAAYEDAEEQGFLLRLPVAKGNSIFQPIYSDITKVGGVEELEVVEISDDRIWAGRYDCFDYDDLGRIVFLTHEEAERALEKMKGV